MTDYGYPRFDYDSKVEFPNSSFATEVFFNRDSKNIAIKTTGGDVLFYHADDYDGDDLEALWAGFETAQSPGSYYHQNIRGKLTYAGSAYTANFVQAQPPVNVGVNTPTINIPATAPGKNVEYVVSATFASYEEAYTLFSYAEANAETASISVYKREED